MAQTAKQELMLSIPGLFTDKTVAWKARAVAVVGEFQEDRCRGLVDLQPAEVKLAAIEASVDGAAAAGGAGPSNAMLADRLGQLESAVQRLQEALSSPPRGNPRQQRSKCSHKRLSTVNEGEDSIIDQDQEQ